MDMEKQGGAPTQEKKQADMQYWYKKVLSIHSALTTYIWTASCAVLCLILRIAAQAEQLVITKEQEIRHYLGFDKMSKLAVTALPVILTIGMLREFAEIPEMSKREKIRAYLINAILVAVSLLFIWIDIPL